MRALYITNLGLLDNLAETQVLPYLLGLSKRGLGLHILSFEKKGSLRDTSKVESVEKKLGSAGIEWSRLMYHNRWGNALDVFLGLIRVSKLVKTENIAVLHARASIPILIAWPVAKLFRRRVIYDRRGTMAGDFVDDVNIKNIFSFKIFSHVLDRIDRFIIRHSDATVVLSERAHKMLEEDRYLSGRNTIIESIPCCVDIGAFSNIGARENLRVNLNGKFVVGYLGSLGTCYLLKEMAAFFKEFKKSVKNAVFLIISHTKKDYIENTLRKEGLAPGNDYEIVSLDPGEVPQYLARADCSVMFIKPAMCKIGSSPTKFAESLAAGVPVCVNRNIGDIDNFIENEQIGVIVDGFNEASYRKSIGELKNLLLDKSLSNRCRRVAGDYFSLTMGIEKYHNVYMNIFKKETRNDTRSAALSRAE